jgi:hypothetical protein
VPDHRDWSWINRPLNRPAPVVERRLWVMVKDARSATASVRPHPLGDELVLRVASDLLWSRVFRRDDGEGLQNEAEAARTAFLGRGWQPAE